MPEPHRKKTDLVKIIEDVVHLQKSRESSYAEIVFEKPEPIFLMIDSTMITQALTNLVKNAGEAIETYINVKNSMNYKPFIAIDVNDSKIETVIKITDNGIGLPKDRSRLFEPYVTTREKGTGLGLSIVKKIIEEHGGELTLEDAPALENEPKLGTAVTIKIFKNELK